MIAVRKATEADIPVIESIILEAVLFMETLAKPFWDRKKAKWSDISKYFDVSDFYIAYVDGKDAGCMALVDIDAMFWPHIEKGKSLYIHRLAIRRAYAKKGVSTALINYAKRQAVRRGINEVRLDTNADEASAGLHRLYEREGFTFIGKQFMFNKFDVALYLWKTDFTVRKAVPDDAEALCGLYFGHLKKADGAEQDMDEWRRMIGRFNENLLYHLLVGEAGGRVVSSVTLVVIENFTNNLRPYAVIENVVTHADYRGLGYAGRLMDAAGEIAEGMGCYKIMLMTGSRRESTLGFYRECGYDGEEKLGFIRRFG
jgi:GNAT superfamily N-acetyltransferase